MWYLSNYYYNNLISKEKIQDTKQKIMTIINNKKINIIYKKNFKNEDLNNIDKILISRFNIYLIETSFGIRLKGYFINNNNNFYNFKINNINLINKKNILDNNKYILNDTSIKGDTKFTIDDFFIQNKKNSQSIINKQIEKIFKFFYQKKIKKN